MIIVLFFVVIVCLNYYDQKRKITDKIDSFLDINTSYKEKMGILTPKDSQELYYNKMPDGVLEEATANHQKAFEEVTNIKWNLGRIENLNRLNDLVTKTNSHLHMSDFEEFKNTLGDLYEAYGFEKHKIRRAFVVEVNIEFEHRKEEKGTYTYYMVVYKYKNEWYVYVPLGTNT